MKRKMLYVAGGLAALIAILVIAAYLLIDANKFRPTVETQLIPMLGQSTSGSIPFKIQGTTSSPVFVPDACGMVSGVGSGLMTPFKQPQQSGQQGISGTLAGLLGEKK